MCKNYIWMRGISEISYVSSAIRDALKERRGATATAEVPVMPSRALQVYHGGKGDTERACARPCLAVMSWRAARRQKGRYKDMKRNMGASIDNKTRRAVYERDGFRCALCDSTDGLQIHHVKPRGEGGADHPMNLITLCWRCHAAAHGDFFYSSPDMFDRSLLGNASVEKWNVRRWLIESMELECVRYVSDYSAERGEEWYPWEG